MKLDIGSGDYKWAEYGGGDGWTTVDKFKPADFAWDMANLDVADGTVAEIYSSHTLEHADDLAHARKALAEWRRALKVGGTLSLFVPNMDWVAKRWLENPDDIGLAFLFGMRDQEGGAHRVGWNPKTLRKDLHDAGFEIQELRIVDRHNQETIFAKCVKQAIAPDPKQLTDGVYALAHDTVLVACPTYRGKSYCLDAYLDAYNAFMYPRRGLFMVDNTPTGPAYAEHLASLNVPVKRVAARSDFQETFAECWREIAIYAKENGWQWVASFEQDNICPPIALDALLNVAAYCKAVHVAHSYPWHKSQAKAGFMTGLGCNLISTELLTAIFAQEQWYTNAIESEIYEYPKLHGYPTVELHNLFEVKHMDDDKKAEYFAFSRRPALPKFGAAAGEQFPRKYGKELEETSVGH